MALSLGLIGLGVAMPLMMMAPAGGQAAGPEVFIFTIMYGGMGLVSGGANVVIIIGGSRMRQCRTRSVACEWTWVRRQVRQSRLPMQAAR